MCLKCLISVDDMEIPPSPRPSCCSEVSKNSDYEGESYYLVDDIIIEILSRLPVKSLLRFKCVCKSWRDITRDSGFIEKHMSQGDITYEYERNTAGFVFWTTLDGLILEQSSSTNLYRIRNPSTRQILDLPNPQVHKEKFCLTILYLPKIKKYMLLHIFHKERTKNAGCEVLIIEVDLRWRTFDIPSLNNLVNYGTDGDSYVRTGHADKDLYFIASIFGDDSGLRHKLVYLDFEHERFGSLEISQEFFSNWRNIMLCAWKYSQIALVSVEDDLELHVWILEDYMKQKWADKKMVISLSFIRDYYPIIDPKTIEVDGIIYDGWLWVGFEKDFDFGYHIISKEVHYKTPPSGEEFSSYYIPSLVSLQGFRPESNTKSRIIKGLLRLFTTNYFLGW